MVLAMMMMVMYVWHTYAYIPKGEMKRITPVLLLHLIFNEWSENYSENPTFYPNIRET